MIDNWNVNRRLALLFKAAAGKGKLFICGVDVTTEMNRRPASRSLLLSIIYYIQSKTF